jgi:hypothetical protein
MTTVGAGVEAELLRVYESERIAIELALPPFRQHACYVGMRTSHFARRMSDSVRSHQRRRKEVEHEADTIEVDRRRETVRLKYAHDRLQTMERDLEFVDSALQKHATKLEAERKQKMTLAMKLTVVSVKKHEDAAQLMRGQPKRDALTLTVPLEIKPEETQGRAIARKRAIVEFGLDIEFADLELTAAGSGRQLGVSIGSSGSF